MTSVEESFLRTRIARLSRVNSSRTLSVRKARPLVAIENLHIESLPAGVREFTLLAKPKPAFVWPDGVPKELPFNRMPPWSSCRKAAGFAPGSPLEPFRRNPAPPSAPPIFACRSRISPHDRSAPFDNTSLSLSTARCFHALTWFGYTLCRIAISWIVLSPRSEVVPENRTGC